MTNPPSKEERLPMYGGQALMEGVMMRGQYAVAAAMRAPDGTIQIHTEPLSGIYKSKWIKVPFARGLVSLWDSLGLGMRFLTLSANLQAGEEQKLEGKDMVLTMGTALLIAAAIFFAAPAFLGQLAERFLGFSASWPTAAGARKKSPTPKSREIPSVAYSAGPSIFSSSPVWVLADMVSRRMPRPSASQRTTRPRRKGIRVSRL